MYGNLLAPHGVRGTGVAFAGHVKVYQYLFGELGMHRVGTHILASNTASIRFAERFGHQREGVLREAIYKNGRFQDVQVYSMLREDFEARYGSFSNGV
jgi:ribosomal-protein-alanine N-acetyltransferase